MKSKKINQENLNLPNINNARKRLVKAKILKNEYTFDPELKEFGLNKTFHIRTYGCQSNVRDGETIKGILSDMGFTWTDDIYNADMVILNTCAIRENAENKVFGEFGLLKKSKTRNPNMILGMSGCMSQSEKVVNKILTKYQQVDFIFGTHNIHKLPEILKKLKYEKSMIIDVWSQEGDIIESLPSNRDNNIKAWVNIMYGCDKFCSYCIVPYTRGKIRSRNKDDILDEVNDLLNAGYKEITLLGQNVNSYGIDLEESITFADLLETIAQTKIERIRFATSNPWNWDRRIIDIAKKYSNIMPYFHLPIQSGSEDVLKRMNRQTIIKEYKGHIDYIRDNLPNSAISTDIIVGFPNETDEDFQLTLDLYDYVKFDNAYTFIFSPREGTPAMNMSDSIDMETKKQRLQKLNELVKKYASENNQKYVGKTLKVLVEGPSKSNPSKLTGYSPEWKVVNFSGVANVGDIIDVEIKSASRFSLNGEVK
ncbi:MAG: tRNA (N6-isopentenyl adenosine(37)-C2)-methylthiotransferase MiaB [Mycoplasma sp.]